MKSLLLGVGLLCLLPVEKTLAQTCSCTERFQFFSEKIRLNYSGFRDKVTAANRTAFDEYTAKYLGLAAVTTSDTACMRVLLDWKKWFRDGHVQVWQQMPSENPAMVRARFAGAETIAITEAQARDYLAQSGREAVEGIWENADGTYRVALTRQVSAARDYAASILKADSVYWMPGQVKFELKSSPDGSFGVRYYMRDHSLRSDTAVLTGDKLQLKNLGAWTRVGLGSASAGARLRRVSPIYRLERLDSSTLLLVLPTMDEAFRQQLDSLMTANRALLEQVPNWVIDCRNNGGGSDITYRLVTPYLYTQRLWFDRMQIYATRDNAGKYEDLSQDKNYPASVRKYGRKKARQILRNEGKYLGKTGRVRAGKQKVRPYPQRIAVLINGNCASSCESFVRAADQSGKVTLIGQNTAGISDYGNLHRLPFSCGNFMMAYPTTRSTAVDAGRGIDGMGIPPDVRMEQGEVDWVDFAREYLLKGAKK